MVPATLITIGIAISQLYGVSQKALGYRTVIPDGFEGDISDLVTPQLSLKSRLEWVFFLMLPIATGCMKASFLFLYMRLLTTSQNNIIRWFLKNFVIFTMIWTAAFFFVILFECGHNFWAIWNSQAEFQAHCSSSAKSILALCITDFVTNVCIICVPIPLVLRLQLSRRKKLAVCLLFLLGGGTLVSSIVRFVLMTGSVLGSINITNDSILGTTACLYWGMVECGLGVLTSCLPTLQILFKKWISKSALWSSKIMLSSQSARSTGTSLIGPREDFIRIQRTYGVTYDQGHDSSTESTTPNYLPHISSEGLVGESYPMQDRLARIPI
ncbi:hypothetical protein F5Y11DRAFT_280565 [Daldinia sp. FL1419]|nr:hypothetical protein F5Y11DRAFT_280565 [Daldinia sp. FL1419]